MKLKAPIPGHLQVENGFSYENEDGQQTFKIPETVFRYGIFKDAELRIEAALEAEGQEIANKFGIGPVIIGAKYHIVNHK